MTAIGGAQHEEVLRQTLESFRRKGFHAIRLDGKCPDGIATKDGKLYAIEILGKVKSHGSHRGKGWRTNGGSIADKERLYSMFDHVFVITFHRDGSGKEKNGLGVAPQAETVRVDYSPPIACSACAFLLAIRSCPLCQRELCKDCMATHLCRGRGALRRRREEGDE